ncbi:hypothetical protein [Paenibacillus aceris]|uniref:Uncharacterized protein n=1 Tax=Paenibacillus aceris TaxID=869555 RepID=A0ABS4I296_9BACL|nr:hypothetical protein [Paenibacillus aceris]MBP1965041.1 hypothetical protein [Paenibacillus aceris]NHW33026.1 hypothetical protein [Paenibacillus aceris]
MTSTMCDGAMGDECNVRGCESDRCDGAMSDGYDVRWGERGTTGRYLSEMGSFHALVGTTGSYLPSEAHFSADIVK